MEAKEKSLREVFGSGPQKLVVPFFQRRYVWNERNWAELLKTIEENDDVKVFLGSIIIKWGENREPSEATIVDGQQRLTTLSLLTKAIYDEFDDEIRNNVKDTIHNVLFYKENTTDPIERSEIKIKHSRVDEPAYSKIIRAGVFEESRVDASQLIDACPSKIEECYMYYRKVLAEKKQEELSKIFNTMYNDTNKMLVRIVLHEKDVNEQAIFDTINRAGERLSTADIIKNNIFKGFIETCHGDTSLRQEVNDLYDQKWEVQFYSSTGENEWDYKRRFGNVSKNNLEFLLYCVACIRWAKEDTKDFSNKLDLIYASETKNYNFEDYKSLVEDINCYAKLFSSYINDLNEKMRDNSKKEREYFSYKDDVRRLLLILEIFGVQMFYPFVLKILKEANGDLTDTKLIEQAKMLETFVMRRRIVGGSVSDYASKCNLILNKGVKQLFVQTGEREISISDVEIKMALTNVNNETARMVLFWIELSRKNKNSDIDGLTYTYTLEHIMPLKWQENWSVSEDQIEKRKAHIYDLGNMTLLRNSLNITVRNSDFKGKIEGVPADRRRKAKEGYKGNTSLDITAEIVKWYDEVSTIWDENAIDKRKNRFFNEIIELWPLI